MKNKIVQFIEVSKLSPLEGHGANRASWLKDKILSEGTWKVPLMVEETKFIIMDGHHRFEVAKAIGLNLVPAILCSYEDVSVWSLRPNKYSVSPEIIFSNYASNKLFPYKTAKHDFTKICFQFAGVAIDELRN